MATSKAKTTTRRDSSARKTTNPNPGPLPLLDTEVAAPGSRRPEEDDSIAPPINPVPADSTTPTSSGEGEPPSTKKKKKKSLVLKTRSVRRTRKINATVGAEPEDGAADNMVQEATSATGERIRKSQEDSPKKPKNRPRQLQEKHGELMETDEIVVPGAEENRTSNQDAAAPVSLSTPSPERPGQQRTSNLKSAKNKLSAFTKIKTVEQYTRVNTSFEDQKGEKNYAPGKSKPAVYDTQTAFERGADWDPMHDSEDDGQLHDGNFVTSENKKLYVPGDYTSDEEFPRAAAEEEEDNEITRGFDSSDENNPFANVRRRFGESQKINEDDGEGEVLQWDRSSRFDKNNNVGKTAASSGGLQQPVMRPSTTIFTSSAAQEERLPGGGEEENDNRQPAFRGSYGFGASRPVEAAKQLAEAGRASLNFAIGSVSSMLSLGDETASSAMRGSIDFGGVKSRPMGASLVYNTAGEGEGLADVENGSNYYIGEDHEINSVEDDDDIAPRFTHLHEFLSGLDLSDHTEDIPPPTRRPVAAEGEAVNFGVEITAGANSGTTGRPNANKIQPEGEKNKVKPNYMMANKQDNKNNLVIKSGQEKESQRSVSTPRRKAPLDMGRGKKATEGTTEDAGAAPMTTGTTTGTIAAATTTASVKISGKNSSKPLIGGQSSSANVHSGSSTFVKAEDPSSGGAILTGKNGLPASAMLDKENTRSATPVVAAAAAGVFLKQKVTAPASTTTPPTTSQQLQQVSTLASQVSQLDEKVNLIATEQIPRLEDQIAAVNEGVHQHGITIADCMTAVVEQLQQVQNIETSLESEVAEGARNNSLLSAATGASKGLNSKMNKLSGITQNRGARANKGIIGRGGNNYKGHHLLKPTSKLTPRSRKKKAEGEARIDEEEEEEAQSEMDPQLEGFDDEDVVGQEELPTTPDHDEDRSIEKTNKERSSGVQPYEVERVLDFVYSEGVSNVKMSGSGRVGTCDANSGTHKNLCCMSAKSCPFLGTQVGSFSCGTGIMRRVQNL